MKIQIVSDLHVEFDPPASLLEEIGKVEAQVCVIAGDIVPVLKPGDLRGVLEVIHEANPAKRLVLIPGNHEYYRAERRESVKEEFASCGDLNAVSLLEGPLEINGVRFIGAVGWFGTVNKEIRRDIADFSYIRDFEPVNWCREDRRYLERQLKESGSRTVVVTHHMPSPKSIHPRYEGNPLNPAFVNDWEDLILDHQPTLWVHGHTHDSMDYMLGKTRVLCNPYGYYGHYDQNPEFDPGLVIDFSFQ